MVVTIPWWRADGHTQRSQPSEKLRQLLAERGVRWKNHDNMHKLLPLYSIVTKGKTLLLFRLVSLLLYLV